MADKPSKWAMERARAMYAAAPWAFDDASTRADEDVCLSDIARAIDAARRDALEEAVWLADEYNGDGLKAGRGYELGNAELTRADIAVRIESLKHKEPAQ
ncbi:MAG: hypothetical protein VR70_05900 [Rhodospirillaceae bacterium BRH_c57]|nr:MAG: hypothetical protein VR70_05900 [Rhodospirillaceae bacterium BRH_c57]